MEILNNNYNVVKNDLLNALDIIDKSDDIDKIVAAYKGIIDFYEDIQIRVELDEVSKKFKKISKSRKWLLASDNLDNYFNIYEDNLGRNGEYYFKIFKEQLKIIEESLNNISVSDNYTELKDDYIYNILYTYFSKNDYRLFELFQEYIQKKTMLPFGLPFCLGFTIGSPIFDNIYIKIRRKHNFEDMLTIIHEISHARVFEDFIKTNGNKEFNKFVCTNIYVEVYPRLQERNFLQFLLNQNPCLGETRDSLSLYFVTSPQKNLIYVFLWTHHVYK